MSPVALGLDVLLAALLLSALVIGVRLNSRLKVLRDSQLHFVKAVADVDQAAARAEAGLQALRSASEETHDQLLTRIETARGLIAKLERASLDAERILSTTPPSSNAPVGRSLAAIAALAEGRAGGSSLSSSAPASARRVEASRAASTPPPAPRAPRPVRSAFDEDLFDSDSTSPDLGPLRGRRKDDR